MSLPFHQSPTHVRYTHHDGYRSGQWAQILSVSWIPQIFGDDPQPGRACFKVKFIDGAEDLWPISEAHLMEFTGPRL